MNRVPCSAPLRACGSTGRTGHITTRGSLWCSARRLSRHPTARRGARRSCRAAPHRQRGKSRHGYSRPSLTNTPRFSAPRGYPHPIESLILRHLPHTKPTTLCRGVLALVDGVNTVIPALARLSFFPRSQVRSVTKKPEALAGVVREKCRPDEFGAAPRQFQPLR